MSSNVPKEVEMFDQPTGAILAALIGFIGGMVTVKFAYEQKSDELFFKALDFLKEGSQNRNLGISAIEIYWNNRRHRDLCIGLLVGSAIYLINESGQGEKAHELNNLKRIMFLLLEAGRRKDTLLEHYRSLRRAISDYKTGKRRGLIIDPALLDEWDDKLNKIIPLATPQTASNAQ